MCFFFPLSISFSKHTTLSQITSSRRRRGFEMFSCQLFTLICLFTVSEIEKMEHPNKTTKRTFRGWAAAGGSLWNFCYIALSICKVFSRHRLIKTGIDLCAWASPLDATSIPHCALQSVLVASSVVLSPCAMMTVHCCHSMNDGANKRMIHEANVILSLEGRWSSELDTSRLSLDMSSDSQLTTVRQWFAVALLGLSQRELLTQASSTLRVSGGDMWLQRATGETPIYLCYHPRSEFFH